MASAMNTNAEFDLVQFGVREAFNKYDKDRNGYIDKEELGQLMDDLAEDLDEEERATMLKKLDTSGDGRIEWKEFWEWYLEEDDGIDSIGGLEDEEDAS